MAIGICVIKKAIAARMITRQKIIHQKALETENLQRDW
jgi:hypothetical protein